MKNRIAFPVAVAIMLLLAAFSTGSPFPLSAAILLLLAMAMGWLSVFLVARTLTIEAEPDKPTVTRGEEIGLKIRLSHRGFLPIAPLTLTLVSAPDTPSRVVRLRDIPGKKQTLSMPFSAAHVGVSLAGVESCVMEDLLGFFRKTVVFPEARTELVVLPSLFKTEPLTLSPGDPGSEMMSRATEDLNAPADIRSYQPGDPLKKVHWKLSLRKRELIVRKFEEPILRDVLILMDCSRPPSWGHPEAEADIRDAMLETAASVFRDQEITDLAVHLPLMGTHPVELEKNMPLPLVMENLARADFSATDRFERVLQLESRRLRKVGCLVTITARLTGAMVELLINMRHLGPSIRLYLITFAPDDRNVLSLVSRLRESGIVVAYVQPLSRFSPGNHD